LGGLISAEPTTPASPEPAAPSASDASVPEAVSPEPADQPVQLLASDKLRAKPQGRIAARRGRPPGQKPGEAVDKEKVTLRLNKELMDDYRDWSWEERCQVGELVEKALLQYRKHRSRPKIQ